MVPWWLLLQISCISADTKSIGYAIIQSSFWLIYTVKGRVCVQLCFLPVYIYAYVLVLRTVRLRDLLRLCAKSYLRLRNYNVIYIYPPTVLQPATYISSWARPYCMDCRFAVVCRNIPAHVWYYENKFYLPCSWMNIRNARVEVRSKAVAPTAGW